MSDTRDILIGGWQTIKLTREQRDSLWHEIKNAICHIAQGKNPSSLSHQKLYRNAYDLVIDGSGAFLLENVSEALKEQCRLMCDRLPSDAPASTLLQSYVREVNQYKSLVSILSDVLMYLERNYCLVNQRPLVEHIAGSQLWFVLLFQEEYSHIGQKIIEAFQSLLQQARQKQGSTDDDQSLNLLHEVVKTATKFDMPVTFPAHYRLAFTKPYLSQWESECKKVKLKTESLTAREFIERATSLWNEELRLMRFINATGAESGARDIWNCFFLRDLPRLLSEPDVSVGTLFANSDLQFAKTLCSFTQASEETRCLMREAVEFAVQAEYRKALAAGATLEDFSALRQKVGVFFREAFSENFGLSKAISSALVKVANEDLVLCNKLADSVNDKIFQLEQSKETSGEAKSSLLRRFICTHVLEPFRVTRSKDAFEDRYRRRLIIRILTTLSRQGLEENAVLRPMTLELDNTATQAFMEECGAGFTHKVAGFFEDLQASQSFAAEHPDARFRVIVLSTFRWIREEGRGSSPNFSLVPEMDLMRSAYEERYRRVYKTRQLIWSAEYGRGWICFNPERGRSVNIWASTMQCLILLMFNDAPGHRVRWSAIQELLPSASKEDLSTLKRHFLGLCVADHPKFLRRVQGSSKIADLQADDEFEPNYALVIDRARFNAPVLSSKSKALNATNEASFPVVTNLYAGVVEAADTGEGLPAAVLESRRGSVDAAIVRVMKAKKTMNHAALVALVNEELRNVFLPSPAFVKSRIDILLERDYLARKESDHTEYRYQA